jgi:hypothetical protein
MAHGEVSGFCTLRVARSPQRAAFCTLRVVRSQDSAQFDQTHHRGHREHRGGTEAHKEGIFGPCLPFRIRAMHDIMHSLMRLWAQERGRKRCLSGSLNQSLKGGDQVRSRRLRCDVSALCPLCVLCVLCGE